MFTLHYDAYQAFEEADHDVCFVDRQLLIILFVFRLATARFFMVFLCSLDTAVFPHNYDDLVTVACSRRTGNYIALLGALSFASFCAAAVFLPR